MDMIRTFFPLGPPPRAEKPLDPALEYRISKLAEYAAANGVFLLMDYVSTSTHSFRRPTFC